MWCKAPGASIRDRLGIQNNYHKSFFRETANIKGVPYFQGRYFIIRVRNPVFQPLPSKQSPKTITLIDMNGRCRSGLLEQRIETTFQVVSILIGYTFFPMNLKSIFHSLTARSKPPIQSICAPMGEFISALSLLSKISTTAAVFRLHHSRKNLL